MTLMAQAMSSLHKTRPTRMVVVASGVFVEVAAASAVVALPRLDSYDATIMAQVGHNLFLSHSVRVAATLSTSAPPSRLTESECPFSWGPRFGLARGQAAESLIMLINPLIVALAAVAVLLCAWAASGNLRQAVVTAVLTVFATSLLP